MRTFIPGLKPTMQQDLMNRRTDRRVLEFVTRVDFTTEKVKTRTEYWEAGERILSEESEWKDG